MTSRRRADPPGPSARQEVIPVRLEDEMKSSYIDYAMSVIIGRAIPDVRDGLKPVHRRTLYAMWEEGNTSDKPYRKSARAVAATMGKYHPHGDAAIYDTLVKMAQPFAYRHLLVDGQGNFGSIDGDEPAAMRYTEARLTRYAEELLDDLDKDTIDFVPNFDGSTKEPTVLPARIPNLLVNGSSGIAVGMATSMLPHNLREVCSAVVRMIDDPECSVDELMTVIPGPDFPTGGIITGTDGIREAYASGQGKVIVRGVAEIEEADEKTARIVIRELPFQVNKARLIESIAALVKEKRIDGISDIRDESDKEGVRVVIDLRRGAMANVVLNQLYKHTALQSSYGIINLAIVDGQPRYLGLPDLIREFLDHRRAVVRRRSLFELRRAEERVHILSGLLIALERIDAVIAAIRSSETTEDAKTALMAGFTLSEAQAEAILQMQLRRLAALERNRLADEKKALDAEIRRIREILSDERNILQVIREEIVEIGETYGDDRRTRIVGDAQILDREDLIEDKPVILSITTQNYIKRISLETYRNQRRGGKGVLGMVTKDEDSVEDIIVASMHDYLLCFTTNGRAYWIKVYDIPEGSRTSKGKAIVNLLNLNENELITAAIPLRTFRPDRYLMFATRSGQVVKVPQDEFARPRPSGINAIRLREGDTLVDVKPTDGTKELILTTRNGQSLRFHEMSVRAMGRNAMGVRGIRLRRGDSVQGMTIVEKDTLLTITDVGYGKRTPFDEFRGYSRGSLGVRNIPREGAGSVVDTLAVSERDEILVMSAMGNVIRIRVSDIPIQGRNTRGVWVMRPDEGDRVVGVALLRPDEE
ncbi:MAG: DNA gyrase subunit A [Methanomicrobiales archaeon]|nr:DNA gyrase subunit A [Methanomicrobiales archaeon]